MNPSEDDADTYADAEKTQPPSSVSPAADYLAQLHALVEAFGARGDDLRTLHEQFMALQHEPASAEQRGEKVQQLLDTERGVLAESMRIQQELVELLRVEHEHLHARGQESAPPSERTPDTR